MSMSAIEATSTSAKHAVVMLTAVMITCVWMRRWNAFTSLCPVNAALHTSRITIEATSTSAKHAVVMLTAVMITCVWMRRWNAFTSLCPVNAALHTSRITAKVVTRMPPAVEVLPPPMNMTKLMNTFVASLTCGTHERSKPLLRGITAATMARRMRVSTSACLNSAGLSHSTARWRGACASPRRRD